MNRIALQLRLVFWVVVFSAVSARAQRRSDDTAHYRTEPVPAHLLPIERAFGSSALGSVYFYGGKKLSSPYSLEIPFYELNDPAVSHHFKTFRTLTILSQLTALVPLAYIVFQSNQYSRGTYWTVTGGALAVSVAFIVIGNSHVNKAVTRYNEMLRQPARVGMSITPVPITGQTAAGVGLSWRF